MPRPQPSTYAEMDHWLNARQVSEIECLVPDLTGVARGKILPRAKFSEQRGMRLPEAVLGMTVTGNTPQADPALLRAISATERDMVLKADPSTVTMVPWAQDPTAQVLHDCHFGDGALVDFAPRSVLRRVLALYAERGWTVSVRPEIEFYLTARNPHPDQPLVSPAGRSGRADTRGHAYSIDAVNEFDPLFEDIYDYCELMALDVDTLIHESGAGQVGMDFLAGPPLAMADHLFYFKRMLREAALKHNMYATFMAKPMAGEPGSAMHLHQTVLGADGANLFTEQSGAPTQAFLHFIGGLQRFMPSAMALAAPYVNSYRRLVRQGTAPVNVHWGPDNRSVGFRVPDAAPAERHVENRLVGADANPYLAIAATLACGYLGMREECTPSPATTGCAPGRAFELPQALPEALTLLRTDHRLGAVLGERFIDVYAAIKEQEHLEFMTVISPWEREHLLLHV